MKKIESSFIRRPRSGGLSASLSAATAAVSLLFLMPADAAIIYSGLQNIPILATSGRLHTMGYTSLTPINLDQAGQAEINISATYSGNYPYGSLNRATETYSYGMELSWGVRIMRQTSGRVLLSMMGVDTLITNGRWGANFTSVPEDLSLMTEFYFGFRFQPSGSDFPALGWGHMSYYEGKLTMIDWAYEDAGASIRVGQMPAPVPESTAPAMLALACFAGAGFRRRPHSRTSSGQ